MIRKSGILIFSILLSIVVVLTYFFSGMAIRAGLVSGLEVFAGAEVNISKVSLSFSPLALDIHDVQITDKNQPELNLLSLKLVHADLEVWPALMGYYVIDELSIEGLSYKSKRSSLGKVYPSKEDDEQSTQTDASSLSDALQLDIPSAEDLLARLDLQTVAKGEALMAESKRQHQSLLELESKLPNKQTLLSLQAEIKSLTEGKVSGAADMAKKGKQLKKLRKQVKQESNNLKAVKDQLSQSRKELSKAITELNKAKSADWQKLQSMANIKDGGLAPISQLLLGDIWGKRIAQLQSFYDIAKPYLPSGSTKTEDDAQESEEESTLVNRILPLSNKPYPDFWIKSAKIDWTLAGGTVDIRLQNITAEHALINSPTQFQLNTKGLPKLESLNVQGDFAVREQMTSNISWNLKKFMLEPGVVGGSESLLFSDGALDSEGSLKLVNNQVEQASKMMLNGAKFTSTKNKTMQKLAAVLNQQSSIPLTIKASGNVGSPSVSVRSQLDSIIGDAVLAEAKQKAKALKDKLQAQLDQKLKEQLKGQKGWLDKLDTQDKVAEELEGIIEDSLKAELQNIKGQAKDKLKNKLLKFGK